jgi:hypothetical protein
VDDANGALPNDNRYSALHDAKEGREDGELERVTWPGFIIIETSFGLLRCKGG